MEQERIEYTNLFNVIQAAWFNENPDIHFIDSATRNFRLVRFILANSNRIKRLGELYRSVS